ncbi:MAG TPA: hypothetical protein VKW76_01195 [Candidatus Binatia bacterium]|nr:hypothetical protein [Candidatus Binatia bacterium]
MRLFALALLVGGWLVAVGGLVASDELATRLITCLAGFAASLAGVGVLTAVHNEHAIWKRGGALS